MENEKLDNILKAYFLKKADLPEKSESCFSAESLAQYASGMLQSSDMYNISKHVKSCRYCSDMVEGAYLYSAYEKQIKLDHVPQAIRHKTKLLHPAYKQKERFMKTYLKNNIWFLLTMASFISSFFMPDHFLQFLILAVIFGLKWVFDKATTRTLIMVYNAWKKHDKEGEEKLQELFKDRS